MIPIAITPRGFRTVEGRHQELLKDFGFTPKYPKENRPLTSKELQNLIKGCPGAILGLDEVDARVLETPGLRIVVRFGIGMDNVDLTAAKKYGIKVSATPGANTTSVAELSLTLMLTSARRLISMDRAFQRGNTNRIPGIELSGKCLGLLGAGRVAQEVAKRAKAFDMKVIAHDPFTTNTSIPMVTFSNLIAESDFLSIHVPLTEDTTNLFDEKTLALMKPGSILINTSRARIVDEKALIKVLRDGPLVAAALDAWDENGPNIAELASLDNVTLSQHIGASTTESIIRTGIMAVEEVYRGLNNEQLLNNF